MAEEIVIAKGGMYHLVCNHECVYIVPRVLLVGVSTVHKKVIATKTPRQPSAKPTYVP